MTDDRREHPRFPLILAVQYLGADSVLDYTENLSASGLFIRTERDFEVGERVTLVVSFPQLLEPVEMTVEVVRMRSGDGANAAGVAVRLPSGASADRARLSDIARRFAGACQTEPSFRILLVEDNALVASIYAAALRRLSETDHLAGLGIEIASDGAAGFDRLIRTPPIDVLVTDLFMPVLSGISLIEKIRSEPALAHLPIVVITSGGEIEREQLESLGVARFLHKPVSYQELATTVRTLIERREGRRPAAAAVPRREARPEGLPPPEAVAKTLADAEPASRR